MDAATAEESAETTTEAETEAEVESGPSDELRVPQGRLANKHQAKERELQVARLLQGLARMGAPINLQTLDPNNLRATAEAFAACRILVEKGICTEAEVQYEAYGALIQMLSAVLQIVEQQQLQATAARRGPVAVKKPGLILPGHLKD